MGPDTLKCMSCGVNLNCAIAGDLDDESGMYGSGAAAKHAGLRCMECEEFLLEEVLVLVLVLVVLLLLSMKDSYDDADIL